MAKRHNGAFIVGSIIGGAVGAVTALWKTPQSGAELRARLGFESDLVVNATSTARKSGAVASHSLSTLRESDQPLSARALGFVESVSAPLVGVKLGHTANNSQPGETAAETTDSVTS